MASLQSSKRVDDDVQEKRREVVTMVVGWGGGRGTLRPLSRAGDDRRCWGEMGVGGVDNNCTPRAKTWGKRGRRATMTTIMGEEVGALVFEECCMEGT